MIFSSRYGVEGLRGTALIRVTMKFMAFKSGFLISAAAAFGVAACAVTTPRDTDRIDDIGSYRPPSISDGQRDLDIDEMIAALGSARAVVVGESHDRMDHHLNQLEIIKGLHRRNPRLAIGMEQFQQPFQSYLDDYIEGTIDTVAMLVGTEYYERWKHDYRLYDPILSYARRHQIPVVALNLPAELTRKAAGQGLDALDDEEAARLPRLDRSDTGYEERLRDIYAEHPADEEGGSFENFYTAQLLWDEGMAARAAEFLRGHPEHTMVILAGAGHVEFGSGIPDRLARRIAGEVLTVVHRREGDRHDEDQGKRADYIVDSKPVKLPGRGRLGVGTNPHSEGVRVIELQAESAAGEAGIRAGDVITAIDQYAIGDLSELRARMWDKQPGDRLSLTVLRGTHETLRFEVTLR